MATGHLGFGPGAPDSIDWYKVTIPADGALQVTVVNDAALTLDLYLYDGAVRQQLAVDQSRDGEQTVFRADLTPGTYVVIIVRAGGFGGYRVSSNFTAQPLEDDPEPNDNPDRAVTLALGGMASGLFFFNDAATT